MRKTKRFAAIIAALALAATLTAPAMMLNTFAADITITGTYETSHKFEIYQVMTGTKNADGTFTNLKWGADVTAYDEAAVSAGDDVTSAQATAIAGLADAGTLPPMLTLKSTGRAYADQSGTSDVAFENLAEGYYIVKDVTNLGQADDANSAWIVQVAGTGTTIEIKNAKPTVDKLIWDEEDDAEQGHSEGWGESADHSINEQFQFKLIATIPDDEHLKEYTSYDITFNDSMSNGVTFENIVSVKVNGTPIETTQYTTTGTDSANKDGLSWTLTIPNLNTIAGAAWGEQQVIVEVIYNAHLNKNAVVDEASREGGTTTDTNNNQVFLNYSNNPDGTGQGGNTPGRTPTDTVWAFTYEMDNTKYKINNSDGNELQGAEFALLDGSGVEISLIYDDTLAAYRPVATGENAERMVSAANGQFNIKGLDAGTYYLRETEAPANYNKIANDIEVIIGATHKEQAGGNTVNLGLTGVDTGVDNKPVDTMNSTLPTTGGIGTTLFVFGGGATAAIVGVYLLSKKRARDAE